MNFREYTGDELRAVSRKAGLASGEARRAKRAAIEQEKRAERVRRELLQEDIAALRAEARSLLRLKREMERSV